MVALSGALFFCRCNETEQKTKTAIAGPQTLVSKTLNNIDTGMADSMMKHFIALSGSDKNPMPTSFFISKDAIHKIVNLLHKELAEQKTQPLQDPKDSLKGFTDGIRIYFASNLAVSTFPLDNTILLVSTKDGGRVPDSVKNSLTRRRHIDYYQHESADSLFMLKNYIEPCKGAQCYGAMLYIKNPSKAPCNDSPNGIPLDLAENMVANFNKGDTINTKGIWFELALFEALDKSKMINGIRIYFAKHPFDKKHPEISLRSTVVITGTVQNPKGPLDDFTCDPAFQEYMKRRHSMFPGDPLDNGELCPDNCN